MKGSLAVIETVAAEYKDRFGAAHDWHGAVEAYRTDDAEHVVVTMGSAVSDARIVVYQLRDAGKKIGLLKIRAYRPFPTEAVRSQLKSCRLVTVIDKSIIFGSGGALALDMKAALFGQQAPVINSFVVGLGGRDFGPQEIAQLIGRSENQPPQPEAYQWFGL